MVCLAIPAGISITGCTRNPAAKYCPVTSGYGLLVTQVASITLQPLSTGISLAYGQTIQAQTPSANTCTGAGAAVNANQYTYGTSNNQLVDISPTGNICAGTWNRNTGGGIADYTYCNFPNPAPTTNGHPYATAYITATADSVTSNPVEVFIHPQVSSITLVGPQQCLSQTATATLDAQACYSVNNQQYLLCAPSSVTTASSPNLACPLLPGQTLASIPSCASAIGYLNYSVGTASVATINTDSNVITADLPGTTTINASVAGSGSSAGYFSTCPPKALSISLANGATTGTITQGVTQNLTTAILDTNNLPLTGLTLDYQSTNPIDISVSSSGSVEAIHPGVASVYAVCQPATCDSSPINELGFNGTGLSISSNPVTITTPGTTSDYVFFAAPGRSQYFVPVELQTGTVGSTVRLPYVPNSMVMDALGDNLYFGSARELMVYNTTTNAVTKTDTSAPGVVLAVSPNNSQLLINDQARQLFYLYNATAGGFTTFAGLGNAAAWTPDGGTLYITDSASLNDPPEITGHTDTLYVYNENTGWSTYPLPPSPLPSSSLPAVPPNTYPWGSTEMAPNVAVPLTSQTPALAIPSVGAFLRGTPTDARTWCPSGTVGNSASMTLYPLGDSVPVQSDALTATTDGKHILGAAMLGGGITLSDIDVTIPTTACPIATTGSGTTQVQTLSPLLIPSTVNSVSLTGINATAVNQVVASPVSSGSNVAFITYDGTTAGAKLPYYVPSTKSGTPGTVGYVTFNGSSAVTAPLFGAFTADDSIFFVSTAGDNEIHYISIPTNPSTTTPPTDTQQISPNLPACTPVATGGNDAGCVYSGTGTVVPATAITVVPRATT
jgi:hypothetical protein